MKQLKNQSENNEKRVLLSEQSIGLSGVMNARELGGYVNTDGKQVRKGLLIRSGQLSTIPDEDRRILSEQLHTGLIIDLRTPREVTGSPDMALQGARYVNLPLLDDENDIEQPLHPTESTTELYSRIMFGDRAKKSYRVFFELLLENPPKRAVVFHSVYGRDRTGVAAALLLTALDVPENTIIEDYLLTKGVFAHTLRYVLSLAGVEYGSVTEYLKKFCKLTDTDIMTLKHKYLS